jgi:hypothetical protein
MAYEGPIISKQEAKEQGLKRYFTGKPCSKGHISERLVSTSQCTECLAEYRKNKPIDKEKIKEYNAKVTAKRRAKRVEIACETCGKKFMPPRSDSRHCSKQCRYEAQYKKQRDRTKEKLKEQENINRWIPGYISIDTAREEGKTFYFTGVPCVNGHIRQRYVSTQECLGCIETRVAKDHRKEYMKNYQIERRQNDPEFKLVDLLRNRQRIAIFNQATEKAKKTIEMLGCTIAEARDHIESQFEEGMTWENQGRGGWHLDHIRPCISFTLSESEQQVVAFNWRNLQPLWEAENIQKGDDYEPHHEVEWARRMRELGYDGELFLLFEEGPGGF